MTHCPHNNPPDDVCRSHRRERREFPKANLWPECGGQCGRVLPSMLKKGGGGNAQRECTESSDNKRTVTDVPPLKIGVVAERPKAAVLKTVDRKRSVGSTPTRSAKISKNLTPKKKGKHGRRMDALQRSGRVSGPAPHGDSSQEPVLKPGPCLKKMCDPEQGRGQSAPVDGGPSPQSPPIEKRKRGRPTHYFKDGYPLLASSLGWHRHNTRNPGLSFVVQRREKAA
jgi:hypothetical protein